MDLRQSPFVEAVPGSRRSCVGLLSASWLPGYSSWWPCSSAT